MLGKRLWKPGSILIHKGEIQLEGFEAKDCMCREVAILALMWGIEKMQKEMRALIQQPGGTGKVSTDMDREVRMALGIKDKWYGE